MMEIEQFNIRVYGILINPENEVLLTDEHRLNMNMTKFPGGGLKYGESTIECLKRECLEEMNQEIDVIEHFYTTDFFINSMLLDTKKQLISIYYLIQPKEKLRLKIVAKPFNFTQNVDGPQCFRFVKIDDLKEEDLSFPVDKKVVLLLKEKYGSK
ncbi:MAG: NUDIX hydrolase [Bacteroidales bacterium]|nr:NUDIX hydrolase [Bacteroidales bacterium]